MTLIPFIIGAVMFLGGAKFVRLFSKALTATEEVEEMEVSEYTEDLSKYVKVVYQSDPIGQRGIVLYLTSFDIEAYKRDKNLLEVPKKEEKVYVSLPSRNISIERDIPIRMLEDRLNAVVRSHYKSEIDKLEQLLREEREDSFCNTQYILNKRLERQQRQWQSIQYGEEWSDW